MSDGNAAEGRRQKAEGRRQKAEAESCVSAGDRVDVLRLEDDALDLRIEHLASGRSEKEILEDYPDLDPRDIQAALAYAAEITRERILPTAVGA